MPSLRPSQPPASPLPSSSSSASSALGSIDAQGQPNYLLFSDVHLGADLVQHARPWTISRLRQVLRVDRELSAMLDHYREHSEPSRDRKSTRLNSSHVEISYAVFCLKKKKKKKQKQQVQDRKRVREDVKRRGRPGDERKTGSGNTCREGIA